MLRYKRGVQCDNKTGEDVACPLFTAIFCPKEWIFYEKAISPFIYSNECYVRNKWDKLEQCFAIVVMYKKETSRFSSF